MSLHWQNSFCLGSLYGPMHPLGQFTLFALPPPPWPKMYRWWELQERAKNTSLANKGWVHSLVLTPSVTWTRSSALSIQGGYPLPSKESDPQTTSDFCLTNRHVSSTEFLHSASRPVLEMSWCILHWQWGREGDWLAVPSCLLSWEVGKQLWKGRELGACWRWQLSCVGRITMIPHHWHVQSQLP